MTSRIQCSVYRQVLAMLLLLNGSTRFGHVVHVAEAVESTHAADPPPPASIPSSISGPDYTGPSAAADECDPEMVSFELVTGYVYTAPTNMLESIPGTLMLTDCLETCQANDSCQAVNYETGLCVLFSSNADSNPGSLDDAAGAGLGLRLLDSTENLTSSCYVPRYREARVLLFLASSTRANVSTPPSHPPPSTTSTPPSQ
ncbi:hypothetical protein KPH14_005141 [Odynerus spinipes]|uniref:Apple domain-containing protein n=1 Tax=Odynerus spinipes TaxID=1348599 RepID=A0AAD9RKN6_9HYME|nr:hypothetical protein KPH14_005141 [Odynerus spinipes]